MIGNDHICDIEGAKNYGLDTIYLHSNISPNINPSIVSSNLKLLEMDYEKVYEFLK